MHYPFSLVKTVRPVLFLLILFCLLGIPTGFLSAQENSAADEIETLLGTAAVTYGQAARFILEASGAASIPDPNEAFAYAMEQKWLPKNASAEAEARLDGISMLVMRSFNFKGGMLYSLTRNAHFSYRELTYRNVIQGRADPAMKTSGEKLLFIVGRVLSQTEILEQAAQIRSAERQETLTDEINEQLKLLDVTDTVARVTEEGVTISVSDIQFLADSAILPDSEKSKLDNIAQILNNIGAKTILVSGHTALAGTEEGRLEISRDRAQAVADYFVSTGARPAEGIAVIGYGATRPVADNDTAEGMAANRRVEITILEQQGAAR